MYTYNYTGREQPCMDLTGRGCETSGRMRFSKYAWVPPRMVANLYEHPSPLFLCLYIVVVEQLHLRGARPAKPFTRPSPAGRAYGHVHGGAGEMCPDGPPTGT